MRSSRAAASSWLLCVLVVGTCVWGVAVRAVHPEDFPQDGTWWLPAALVGAGLVAVPVVGAVLVTRVPASRYGWNWCGLGAGIALLDLAYALDETDLAGPGVVVVLAAASVPLAFLGLIHVLLRFPTGGLPGSGWRWLARVADTAAGVSCLAMLLSGPDVDTPGLLESGGRPEASADALATTGVLTLSGCVVAAALAVLARYRGAGPVERLQLRWFLGAAVAVGLLALVSNLGMDPLLSVDPSGVVSAAATGVSFLLMSVAVAVAVLRYRLYEIDRIVSRTVSYAVLTGLLVAVYIGLVTTLRPLLEPVTGTSELAVAVSTLAAAAVFGPARRRVQVVVDRRFDRTRYDAARTVDAYTAQMRTQVDLDGVAAGLRDAVSVAVGPERVGLWLRDPAPGEGRLGP
jgi:hypothetical protein